MRVLSLTLAMALHAAAFLAMRGMTPPAPAPAPPIEVVLVTPSEPPREVVPPKPVLARPPPPREVVAPPPPRAAPSKPTPTPQPAREVAREPAPVLQEELAPLQPPAFTAAAQPAPPAPAPERKAAAPEPPRAAAVEPPRFDAAYLNNAAPAYPMAARRRGEVGTVRLQVFVSPAGAPERIELNASSGSPTLDRAAQDAVARWRFAPARRGDEPVGAWVIVPIVFRMEG